MNNTKKIWKKVSDMNIQDSLLLGPINAESLLKDPKHLAFTLSRYKFSAKILKKCGHIVEIGCGEGLGSMMFLAETKAKIAAIDFDNKQISYAKENIFPHTKGRVEFIQWDIAAKPYQGKQADGLVCLDVIEHIHSSQERKFIRHCVALVKKGGVAIFGTPNQCAAKYASKRSKIGHINLFDPTRLTSTLEKYFSHVFLFSMNDEIVHTGYDKMAHYLMALCVK